MNNQGKWLSIVDFSKYREVSISTVRRYIKANRVQHKEENGRYLVWASNYYKKLNNQNVDSKEMEAMQSKLRELMEENEELKMLIKIYEQNDSHVKKNKEILPEIPMQ